MNNSDIQRLRHIYRYCLDASEFLDRFGGYDDFVSDSAFHHAISMCILQIGELSNGLSAEFREETGEQIQWGLVRGMRNWVAHAYTEMDDDIIWETVTGSIPQLLNFCKKQLEPYQEQVEVMDEETGEPEESGGIQFM